ncbi:MAG: hypothetical protein ACQERD_06260 [Campylobacterota bacterium]
MKFQLQMEDKFLILRLSLLVLLFFSNSYAVSVLIAIKPFQYEQKITKSDLRLITIDKLRKNCKPLTLDDLKKDEYITTHYINDKSIICKKDVKVYKKQGVTFKFGALEIEKKGRVIYENDDFIRIKKIDGTIEKIYKDGKIR